MSDGNEKKSQENPTREWQTYLLAESKDTAQ